MTDSQSPMRVLIIEDEEDMCWALRTLVEAEGYRPTVARSAQEALAFFSGESFRLAFVDLKLPDMEGLELVGHLHRQYPILPCVLVSGYLYDDDETVQASLKAGLICGFIGKPFLLSQVRDALRLTGSSR
jgi:DNA-binding NtrC family response regulator